jgi:hypothetical protein
MNTKILIFKHEDGITIANKSGRSLTSSIKPEFSFEYNNIVVVGDSKNKVYEGRVQFKEESIWEQLDQNQIIEILEYVDSIEVDEEKSALQVALTEALRYLEMTDYIEAKFTRDVIRKASMSKEDFISKYSEILDARDTAIATVNDARLALA